METIIEKLKKIKALAEQGYKGEAQAAKKLLEDLMKKYNIQLEDLESDIKKRYEFKYSSSMEKELILHLFVSFTNGTQYRQHSSKLIVILELTDLEYMEMKNALDTLIPNLRREFKKQQKTFLGAFIYKTGIFPNKVSDEDNEKSTLTPEEIRDILNMADNLRDIPIYRKQLT